ncbi:Annexin [Serendipita vermifera]|nr:Annexin [Serendipita vermifera]
MSQVFHQPQPTSGAPLAASLSMPSPLLHMPSPSSPSKPKQSFYLGTEVLSGTPFLPGYDYTKDIERLGASMRGIGTRDKELIAALVPRTSAEMQVLQLEYPNIKNKPFIKRIKGETSGDYRLGLVLLTNGALGGDAWILRKGLNTMFETLKTKLEVLTDILVARNRDEIVLLRSYLHSTKGIDLDQLVRDMIPANKTAIRAVFSECLMSEIPVPPAIEVDYETLCRVLPDTDPASILTLLPILLSRPLGHLYTLNQMWQEANFGTTISQVIARRLESDPELRDVLVYAVESSTTRGGGYGIWRDIERIEDAFLANKPFLLTIRLIRAHWDQPRFTAIIRAYDVRYKKKLFDRVHNLSKGNWRRVLEDIVAYPRAS